MAPTRLQFEIFSKEEVAAWNKGDADAYSRHFAKDGTFTNLLGMFFQGREAFRERHDADFHGAYRGSTKQLDIISLKFVRPDVAIVETLQTVSGLPETPSGYERGCERAIANEVVTIVGEGWRRMENRDVSQRRRKKRNTSTGTAMKVLKISAKALNGYPSCRAMLAPTQVLSTLKSTPIILP